MDDTDSHTGHIDHRGISVLYVLCTIN